MVAEQLNDNQLETLAAHGAVRDCSTTGRAGDSRSTVWAKVELVRKAATAIRELRGVYKELQEVGKELNDMEAANARLRAALESIRKQTECNTLTAPKDAAYRCWFNEYDRHSPDCQLGIAEEAAAALAEGGDDATEPQVVDKFVSRLLAVMRAEECACAEMTCDSCIAKFIEAGQFKEADHGLSLLEQLIEKP